MAGIRRCRQVRITVTLWSDHANVTLTTRDGFDDFKWDRRRGLWDIPVDADRIGLPEIQMLAQAVVERLKDPV